MEEEVIINDEAEEKLKAKLLINKYEVKYNLCFGLVVKALDCKKKFDPRWEKPVVLPRIFSIYFYIPTHLFPINFNYFNFQGPTSKIN